MATTGTRPTRDRVLISLHIAFALLLVMLSLLLHGRIPGFSADESAALGFLLFFGLGLPLLVAGMALIAFSLFAGGHYLGRLAIVLIAAAVLTSVNVWIGVFGSLAYFALAIWAFRQRHGQVSDSVR